MHFVSKKQKTDTKKTANKPTQGFYNNLYQVYRAVEMKPLTYIKLVLFKALQ